MKRSIIIILVGVWAVFLVACSGATTDLVDPIVIYNGTVIDGTGADPIYDAAVIIDQGIIIAVGSEAELEIPREARMIDAEGGTILPGIIDTRTSILNQLKIEDGQIEQSLLELHLVKALRAGLTTLRATGLDWREEPDITAWKAALESHGNSIPTVRIAGPLIAHAEGTTHGRYPQTIPVTTADEAGQVADDLMGLGLDQIGYMLALPSRNGSGEGTAPTPDLTLAQQQAIIEAGHAQGLWVIAQAVFPDDAMTAIAAGVDEIPAWPALGQPMPDELITALVENDIPIITGYTVYEVRPQAGDARRFIDAGGTIAFGTFAPNSNALDNYYYEMNLMAQVGDMTPMEIIMSATSIAAEVVGLGDAVGSVEAGKNADIIVLRENPLDNLKAFRDVAIVIKDGELIHTAEE